jgi:hypothetical protein
MRNLFLIILITIIFFSCSKNETNPVLPTNNVTGLDIAAKLKQWADAEPDKFVICVLGDTSDGKLYDVGDLVTNLEFNPDRFNWLFTDSLHIDTAMAAGMDHRYSSEQLEAINDSLSLSFDENQMTSFLYGLGFKLRMMEYDSLTYNLNIKLLQWCSHQSPPKVMWSGFYSFVNEGPNSGGYSPVLFTYRGVQDLRFFTRKTNQSDLQNIVNQVDTSLSFTELHNIMAQIADIKIHNTTFIDD